MSTNREKVAIYIMAIKKSQKRIEEEKQALMQYCLCNNYEVVNTFVETRIGTDIDYPNKLYQKNCRKSLEETLKKRNFKKIVILNFNALGNDILGIDSTLDLINQKNRNVEVVNYKITWNILINSIIMRIKSWFGRKFDFKNRVLYMEPNCECKTDSSYYYREREDK